MSEYICPITNELCPRPGRVATGATVLSDEGYCAGEKSSDPICPEIINYVKGENLLSKFDSKNIIYERESPTTVYVRDTSHKQHSREVGVLITIIESGKI